jgi:hypothetical protein
MRPRIVPAQPTVESVQGCLQKWETLEKYTFQEASLGLLFQKFCPYNNDIIHVLLKVSALNDFYSTNIFDTHAVAKHIATTKNVDDRIAVGDHSLVNQIASVTIGGKTRNFYSFASKYCNHHRPEAFPIYDSYVEKMLLHFQTTDQFSKFSKDALKQYVRFVEIVMLFRKHYFLEQFTLRQIDIFLWLAGKDAFGRFNKLPKKVAEQEP